MKKLFVSISMLLTVSMFSQENPNKWYPLTLNLGGLYGEEFIFIKEHVSKLNTCKDALIDFLSPLRGKENLDMYERLYLGATILKTPEDTIGDYIKLIDIPLTDKFIVVSTSLTGEPKSKKNEYFIDPKGDGKIEIVDQNSTTEFHIYTRTKRYYYYNDEFYYGKDKILLQNVKSKLFYVVNSDALFYDYSRCAELRYGAPPATIYKILPKTPKKPTVKEQELINRYKALIKSGDANTKILKSIQVKCLTRGYFDERKMTKIDKQTWNKNISALKVKAGKLSEIDRYEDKDDKAQDKLTISELGVLDSIYNWLSNYSAIE